MATELVPTTWSDAVAPGGVVCAAPMPNRPDGICGMPVESVPCPEHARCTLCTHDGEDHDAGECWARVEGGRCSCWWYTPAYQEAGL